MVLLPTSTSMWRHFPAPNLLCHATTCNRVTVKHECFLRFLPSFVTKCVSSTDLALLQSLASRILTRLMTKNGISVLLTTLLASELHASTYTLSLTIVLPRRQPSPYPCGSRSVMGYLGTDSSSRPRDDQPNTLPLGAKQQCQHIGFSLFAISLLSWQTPRPFCPVQCIAQT